MSPYVSQFFLTMKGCEPVVEVIEGEYSPLTDATVMQGASTLEVLPWCGKINLRSQVDEHFLDSCRHSLGIEPPLEANTVSASNDLTVFWLGPNEWLVHCDMARAEELMKDLRTGLKGRHYALTEVSDYYLVMRLSGSTSRDILARGTPFDLHSSRFKAGACAQTRFAHASILLHAIDDQPSYDIQVRWSFARYLWDYLVQSSLLVESCK